MDVVFDLEAAPRAPRGAAVTIGAYDGVHLGHQAVLRELRRRAAERGLETVVVTFDRHPATVVRPESAPKLLTDLDQKLEALAATGNVDRTVVVRFDRARSQEEPEQFVREVLVDGLDARLVVVGEDFHFGRARRGNVALLRELGWFEVVGLGLVPVPGVGSTPVSSTAVRSLVAAGDVQGAARLLGRPFEVRGVVISGDRRGRAVLGFPTANIEVAPDLLVPALGIYAGWYERPDGTVRPAAISMGRRPTFHVAADAPAVLEAYVLDFNGDLYDEPALVRFVSRLRDERRFDSPAALKAQMYRDVDQTRTVLGVTQVP
ncbi:MAG: bifunctional riboflavin kinase/FAD synthetase [Acidimicrobiales bacterium]